MLVLEANTSIYVFAFVIKQKTLYFNESYLYITDYTKKKKNQSHKLLIIWIKKKSSFLPHINTLPILSVSHFCPQARLSFK